MLDLSSIRQSLQESIANAIAEAKTQVEDAKQYVIDAAVREGERTAGPARQFIDGAIDNAIAAGKWALQDEVWGEDINVDHGKTPTPFGYGEHKNTLWEGKVGTRTETEPTIPNYTRTVTELAAKLRVFGHVSKETLSASIGAETEVGYKSTSKMEDPQGNIISNGETFIGQRLRAHAEAGPLGSSAGIEGFLGAMLHHEGGEGRTDGDSYFNRHSESVAIGTGGAAEIDQDILGGDFFVRGWAGIDARAKRQDHFAAPDDLPARLARYAGFNVEMALNQPWNPMRSSFQGLSQSWGETAEENGADALNPLGVNVHNTLRGFVGYVGEASASAGPTGLEVGGELFAGARAAWRPELGLAWAGEQFGSVFLDLEGRAGVGAGGKIAIGYDREKGKIDGEIKGGAALGLGFAVGIGGSIATKKKGFGLVATE